MGAVQVLSIRLEAQTWDEAFEIASGYSFLRTGEYRISYEQPPLARILAALPLMWLNPSLPLQDVSWLRGQDHEFGHEFLYHNRVPADEIVFAARLTTILTTLVLGLTLAWWTRRVFGLEAALGCVVLFAFDPNLIAVGRYVKNDVLVTLVGFLSIATWGEYLRNSGRRWLWATGALFGLALASKFSAIFLAPVYLICWFLDRWHNRRPFVPLRCLLAITTVLLVGVAALLSVYAPAWRKLIPATQSYRAAHPEVKRIGNAITVATPQATEFIRVCTQLGLQDHPLLMGVARFVDHTTHGHQAYLLGMKSEQGWWYYFPVAFVVKTPVATLMAILLAMVLAVRRWRLAPAGWVRSLRLEWWLCVVPCAIYLPLAMLNRVNTGERHLFPMYPFLFILTAAILSRTLSRFRVPLTAAITTLLVVESLSIYPHYLAFFNFAVGGPGAGPRYLVDSNLDWGQDLLKLRDFWIANGRPPLCVHYFGTADMDYYGIKHVSVPRTWETEERASVNCLAAVSATALVGMYDKPDIMEWLRDRVPMAKIGYSIYVYDLRKR